MDGGMQTVDEGMDVLETLLGRYIGEDDTDMMDDIAERIRLLACSDPRIALHISRMLEHGVVFSCDPDLAGLYRRMS